MKEVFKVKINDQYRIDVCVVEWNHGKSGDVYDCFEDFKREKSNSGYIFGFIVVENKTGIIPVNCNDWNDTVDEAIADYEYNVLEGEE